MTTAKKALEIAKAEINARSESLDWHKDNITPANKGLADAMKSPKAEGSKMIEPEVLLTASRLYLTARIVELETALQNMLEEFDDPNVTDDIRTQYGMPANTVKALQKARKVLNDRA